MRDSWHDPRWILRAFELSKRFKHRLHPLMLKIFAHSIFGSGPSRIKTIVDLIINQELYSDSSFFTFLDRGLPMRCSLSDSNDLQCFWQIPQFGSWAEWNEILMCSTRCSILLYCLKHAAHLFLLETSKDQLNTYDWHRNVCQYVHIWMYACMHTYLIYIYIYICIVDIMYAVFKITPA